MASGKKVTKSALVGDGGIALIHTIVSRMRHVWREGNQSTDVGIDGSIELLDPSTGEASGQYLYVQSKARDTSFSGETDEKFYFICDERDVDYWMKHGEPVLLICSHPKTGEAWWVNVHAWFSDPRHRASLRVDFSKAADKFDSTVSSRLFAIADPHGRAHTPVPVAVRENLVSNLLPVELPDVYYSAATSYTKAGPLYAAQRASKYPVRNDFVLRNNRIYTWRPLYGTALARAGDTAANAHPVGELLAGGPDSRRLLVQLLGAGLQEDLGDNDFRWNADRKFLHYRPTDDLSTRKVLSTTGQTRLVFKAYMNKKDPTKVSYYRHSALRWQFLELDGVWFCAITPDYFFTKDGRTESAFADDLLRGIKKLDKNQAVLGETRAWAAVLRNQETLLGDEDRILDFGDLLEIKVDGGIDDAAWKHKTNSADEVPDGQRSLFDEPEDVA